MLSEWRCLQRATALARHANFFAWHRFNDTFALGALDLQFQIKHRHGAIGRHDLVIFLAFDLYLATVLLQILHQLLHFFDCQAFVARLFNLVGDFPPVLDVSILQQQRVFHRIMQRNPAIVILHDDLVDVICLNLCLRLVFLRYWPKLSYCPALRENTHDGWHHPINSLGQILGNDSATAFHLVAIRTPVVTIKRNRTIIAQFAIFNAQAVGPVRFDD